jgi:hypothetical protein
VVLQEETRPIPFQNGAGVEVDVDGGLGWLNPGAHQLFTRRGEPFVQPHGVVRIPTS